MFAHARVTLPFAVVCLACSEVERPLVDPQPTRLERTAEWVRPDLSPETDWITFPTHPAFDEGTGHLLLIDRDTRTALEVTPTGDLVRTWGRRGQGPGEIRNASSIAVDAERLYISDTGNLKMLVFRRSGELEGEFRTPHFFRDIEVLDDGRIVVVPGRDHAIDIIDHDGGVLESFGDRRHLVGECSGCGLARLGDGRVAVVIGGRPEIFVFTPGADEPLWINLYEMPLIAQWRESEAARMREIGRLGGGRWWMPPELHVVGPSHVLAAIAPPGVTEIGMEIWRINVDTGAVDRYDFGEPLVGYAFDVRWPRLFTTNVRTGAVVEYRFPHEGRR